MTPAPITHDRYLATRHFGSLDGLRFICIAAVIWHHAPKWDGWREMSVFFYRGHVGVDFFFVLSGFLITTLLLREETARGAFSLRAFYWRRILRIIPIYFLVVSVAAFYALVIKGYDQLAILPSYFLFLSNFLPVEDIGFLSITWSLAVEEQYYLLWPALLLLTPRRWIVTVLVVLIAINVLAALEVFRMIGIYPIYIAHLRLQISGATYAPILMGSLTAILLHRPTGFAALRPLTTFRGAALVWFVTLLVSLAAFPGALEGLPNLVVHSLMTLMLVSLVIREDNAMASMMQLRPIARVGQISYGIYLYHLFALAIVNKALEVLGISGDGWVLPLYFALSIVISEISFRTYEAWFMQFRHHGPGRVNPHPPKPAGPM